MAELHGQVLVEYWCTPVGPEQSTQGKRAMGAVEEGSQNELNVIIKTKRSRAELTLHTLIEASSELHT